MTPPKPNFFQIGRDAEVLVLTLGHPVGSLSDSVVMSQLAEVLHELDDDPTYKHAVVDFTAVDYFGSSLLESLRQIWTRLQPRGGRMALATVAPIGREILGVVKFDQLWPLVDSIDAALVSVRAG